ncbi:MAG TPA: histidine kinase N-terminal domain-containing protein [Pseudonocardiaceae bacterium]|nr:histidine kinase N-terminal domain-containing protein [Pseudonocardiaceae bacterium]
MATLSELLAEHTRLPGAAVDHLQLVVAEWQLLSDLGFADLLMWVPLDAGRSRFVCVAQVRPTTSLTAHPDDMVGAEVMVAEHPQLRRAIVECRVCREEDPRWHDDVPVRRETIPVRFGSEPIAVLSRETNLGVPRVPSPLEIAYLGSAADLCQMVADGAFPSAEPAVDVHTSPRVGDGLIRVDANGAVVFASPNALSAYHRMGHPTDLVGVTLAPLTRELISDPFDATEIAQLIRGAVDGTPSMRIEAEARGATVLFRALPLRPRGEPAGALVLVRDVTEVRRKDRALLSKDATIREIHHRVKNNLQTVAALLRLQARRTSAPEARHALDEAMRRVASIAVVHETLSTSLDERVDIDEVIDRVIPMLTDVAITETRVTVRREGSCGVHPAELATPLVMVLAELVQNALEHAFEPSQRGEIVIRAERSAGWLDIVVADDGHGLPPGFSLESADRLGLQIVRTLVDSELAGSLSLRAGEHGGTEAALRVPLKRRRS